MLSTFISIWFVLYYTPTSKRRGVYCFSSIHPSICSSIRNKYIHHIFLRNYWWQPHDLWCAAWASGSILHLPFHTCIYILTFLEFCEFFCNIFLRISWWQPRNGVLYAASARGIISCLPISHMFNTYFLLADLIYFFNIIAEYKKWI